MELPDLGGRSIYALTVRAAGAFRVADFLNQPPVGKKNGPISRAKFQRGKEVGGLGKAMQVAVPPVGTALREMFGSEESEGHCLVAASWLASKEHLPNQSWKMADKSQTEA